MTSRQYGQIFVSIKLPALRSTPTRRFSGREAGMHYAFLPSAVPS
jgi:hypothetical protein